MGDETHRFDLVEHTADVGIRAWGDTLEEMLENAAAAMFSLTADIDRLEERAEESVKAEADTPEDLLVGWLEELLYLAEAKRLALRRARVDMLEPGWRVRGRAFGCGLEECRSVLRGEIKGVTYHRLELAREGSGWRCQVIFDV